MKHINNMIALFSVCFSSGPKTLKEKTMSLLRTLVFVSFCAAVSLFSQSQLLAQSGSPVFVKVNPAGTYLLVDPCDQAAPPTSVTLSSLGIVPGEFIRLTRVGAFKFGANFNDDGTSLAAVFRGPPGFIAPGPDSQHVSFNSGSTFCNNIPTNIAADFNVDPQIVVQVPVGATEILFTAGDSFWSDNTDPNNDYGVSIEFGLSWARIVTSTADSGAGSLRAAIAIANGFLAATTITFDPAVFPPPPTLLGVIVPLSALPNLTGPGDTIDGTGAGVVLDGTNLTAIAAAGLRVRASNYTIQGLSFQNFSANDAIVVEGTNARPVVTDVTIASNSFFNNRRGVRIDGGVQDTDTEVTASVLDNILRDNTAIGIFVRGNGTSSDGLTGNGGNTVSAVIDGNVVQGKTIDPDEVGSGIIIQGGSGFGSDNIVTAIVTNNTVTHILNDGIVANGCTANATGSNNTVNATITGNTVKYEKSANDLNNNGIIITGATGETAETSFCSFNKISFLVSENNVSGFKTNNITVDGGDEGTNNNTVQGSVLTNHVSDALGRGIQVVGGPGNNHSVDVLLSDNISNSNGVEGIRVTAGAGINNSVSIAGIINNTTTRNGGDGIGIRSNSPGIVGGTPISGNRSDRNGGDGIDINSVGYILSNNRADRNVACGISLGANTDGGGNVARNNGGGDICP